MVTPGQLARRAQLYDQLATTIAAGLPLMQALELASRNRSLGSSQKNIRTLLGHLQEGHTFADSMKKAQGWLPEFDVALLSVGEESGRLDSAFKVLGRYYASHAMIIRDTMGRLIIPFVTLHVFLLVFPVSFLTGFVLGIINNDYKQCVPFIIEKIIVFGLLYSGIFFSAFATQGNRGSVCRSVVEFILSMIPVLRTAIKYLALSRLAMALNGLLSAGVNTTKSWELAAGAAGSQRLKREILSWTPQFELGTTPAEMVAQIRYFPDMFTNVYQSAEISGKHDETLERLHVYFEDEGFRKLQTFTVFFSLAIFFTIAIAIGIFVIGFYVGRMNDMMQSIQ